ncbi:MAG: hypothetical protein AAB451_00315 [Patescibacteria group bacterium]
MLIIINGKIQEKSDLFKTETVECGTQNNPRSYKTYFLGDIQIKNDHDGNFYLNVDDLAGVVPYQIPPQMITGFSIMSGLSGTRRLRGIYVLGKSKAVVDGVRDGIIKVNGASIEDVRSLYSKIRAGTILPAESWEAEQIKPTFKQRLSYALHQVFLR